MVSAISIDVRIFLRLAVDIGGTFTDAVILDEQNQKVLLSKVPTTPPNYTDGVINSIKKLIQSMDAVESFTHGTTVGTNALIQETLADTGLLTTKGFRDILEIGRGNRVEIYDPYYKPPPPPIPRNRRLEIEERIRTDGQYQVPLNIKQSSEAVDSLATMGVDAIAICFINSYVNDENEKRVKELIKTKYPQLYVTISSEISREYNEYERTVTAVVNASLLPIMVKYLSSLENAIQSLGYRGRLMIMQSNGGVMTSLTAKLKPIHTINSGLVGGIIAVKSLSDILGLKGLIGADMGGTSFDVELVINGDYETAKMMKVRTPHSGFDGYPLLIQAVDIHAIGTGGGSVAWIDEVGALHVGPRSAQARPGPACYGHGGTEPTVTDANMVLGRLNPDYFLGGQMKIYPNLAKKSVQQIADNFGMDMYEAAEGILKISVTNMAGAIRTMTVMRGIDPREFSMVSFGGAGPIHAALIARELSIPKVIVSTMPGNFSAWGMLMTDIRHDYAQTYLADLEDLNMEKLTEFYEKIEQDALKSLNEQDIPAERVKFVRGLDVKYMGQGHAITLVVPDRKLIPEDRIRLAKDFDEAHLARYLHNAPEMRKETVSLRVEAIGLMNKAKLPKIQTGNKEPPATAKKPSREIYIDGKFRSCTVYERSKLLATNIIRGPSVIEEVASTTMLLDGQTLQVDEYGHLVITELE